MTNAFVKVYIDYVVAVVIVVLHSFVQHDSRLSLSSLHSYPCRLFFQRFLLILVPRLAVDGLSFGSGTLLVPLEFVASGVLLALVRLVLPPALLSPALV